ncbi:hypothetical protein TPE_2407 [Treponema pedis str. T A4]|uniref:Uncharacterized protein n=1 Tax=Treponema pedis str. T A4 TaxID=1291379 RepID=S6A4X3_9SPIR|nr:hypothetical protein TPE_2407 [Treponema pedis str. T A4]
MQTKLGVRIVQDVQFLLTVRERERGSKGERENPARNGVLSLPLKGE